MNPDPQQPLAPATPPPLPAPPPDVPTPLAFPTPVALPPQRRRRGPGNPWLLDHDPSSRELLLWWCLWLLGSWGVILLLDSPVPAARWMVFAGVLGMMLLWPVFRLSQAASPPAPALPGVPDPPDGEPRSLLPARQVLKDWLSLNLVFQAVLWPLQLTAHWHLGQTAWLSAAVAAWSLLTAAVVAWGARRPSRGVRISAMILCVLLMLGEPLVMAAVNLGPASGPGPGHVWQMVLSPIDTLWAVTDSRYNWQPGLWGARIVGVAAAAVLAWVALAYSARSARDPRRR